MMKLRWIAAMLIASSLACRAEKTGRHDVEVTDITKPQVGYAVVAPETSERIATQEQAMRDIRERLDSIDQSLGDIKADVKILQSTNIIVGFLLSCAKYLIPGLIIAAFGIWFKQYLDKRKPRKPRTA